MPITNITLPHNYVSEPYQQKFLDAMCKEKYRRAIQIWHRRAGKDLTDFNFVVGEALIRKGVYWIVFPTYTQGKKALWEAITHEGVTYLSCIPDELLKGKNGQEMRLELHNGSIIRILGADNPDSLRGGGPVGIVISEYATMRPDVIDIVTPMLLRNDGWLIVNSTPLGNNHFHDLYQSYKDDPEWYVDKQTIADTGVISAEDIQKERKAGKSEEFIQQEYFCSFKGSVVGSFYIKELDLIEEKGQMLEEIQYDDLMPVHTYWDLGMNDSTVIWFAQLSPGGQLRLIDYYENNGESLQHYAGILNEKGYRYGKHYAPHDIEVRELGTGKSRLEIAQNYGVKYDIVPKLSVQDGINAVRSILPRCWFSMETCSRGLKALRNYRKKYDEINQCFKAQPLHDWSSHAADAFRYFAVAVNEDDNHKRRHIRLKKRGGKFS